eukprot:m.65878 g.65878  ORF g.65878 m.65878 type:complete len:522 (+) comp7360_c0_seq3:42-1607(+)
MFSQARDQRKEFVEKTRKAREDRQNTKLRIQHETAMEEDAIVVQSVVRRFLAARRVARAYRTELDAAALDTPRSIYRAVQQVLYLERFARLEDQLRLAAVCKAIRATAGTYATSYLSLASTRDMALRWLAQARGFVLRCTRALGPMQGSAATRASVAAVALTAVMIIDAKQWPLTTESDPARMALTLMATSIVSHVIDRGFYQGIATLVQQAPISAVTAETVVALAAFPLRVLQYKPPVCLQFVVHVLSGPAILRILQSGRSDVLPFLVKEGLGPRILAIIASDQTVKVLFRALGADGAAGMLGNTLDLLAAAGPLAAAPPWLGDVIVFARQLLEQCHAFVLRRATNLSVEHALFGWVTGTLTQAMRDGAGLVLAQLRLLWAADMIRAVFGPVLREPPAAKKDPKAAAKATPAPPIAPAVRDQADAGAALYLAAIATLRSAKSVPDYGLGYFSRQILPVIFLTQNRDRIRAGVPPAPGPRPLAHACAGCTSAAQGGLTRELGHLVGAAAIFGLCNASLHCP